MAETNENASKVDSDLSDSRNQERDGPNTNGEMVSWLEEKNASTDEEEHELYMLNPKDQNGDVKLPFSGNTIYTGMRGFFYSDGRTRLSDRMTIVRKIIKICIFQYRVIMK